MAENKKRISFLWRGANIKLYEFEYSNLEIWILRKRKKRIFILEKTILILEKTKLK